MIPESSSFFDWLFGHRPEGPLPPHHPSLTVSAPLPLFSCRSVILLYSILWPLWGPKVLGILGVVCYWQKLYDTILYAFQFINNEKYKKISLLENILCVGASNFIWILFPVLGFYASTRMIMEDSFAVYTQ